MPEERGRLDMRVDRVMERQTAWLARRLNLTRSAVIRLAVTRLAQAEGMPDEAIEGDRARQARNDPFTIAAQLGPGPDRDAQDRARQRPAESDDA